MNPKEGLRAVARNPWVQRGVLITTVLLSSEACIPRPETRPTPPPAPTVPAKPKEIPTSTEIPKPVEKKEVRTTLSPQDLYKALLATPIALDDLPKGFESKGNSAGNPDLTAQAFSAIGQVNILISENDPRFFGRPNAAITYVVFPKSSDAKGAFDTFKTQSPGKMPQGFDSPAVFTTSDFFGGKINTCVVLFDNVFVGAILTTVSSTDFGDIIAQDKTISLARTGIKHLKKVGLKL